MTSTTGSSPLSYLGQLITGKSSRASSVVNQLIGGSDPSGSSIATAINKAVNAGKKATDSSSSTTSNLDLSASVLSLLQSQSQSGSGSDLMSQIFSSPNDASPESKILAATLAKQILKSAVNGTLQYQASTAQTGGVQSAIDAYNKQFNTAPSTSKKA
jgi:hypothetical protein